VPVTIAFCPGAVTKGTNIDVPAGSPSIRTIINATIFRGSDGAVAAAEQAVTVTRVDRDTIQCNVDTLTRDLLVVRYLADYEILAP